MGIFVVAALVACIGAGERQSAHGYGLACAHIRVGKGTSRAANVQRYGIAAGHTIQRRATQVQRRDRGAVISLAVRGDAGHRQR